MWATSAAMRSLSPKRISSLAMASFSLTIGTQPSSSRRDERLAGVQVLAAVDEVVAARAAPARRRGRGAASARLYVLHQPALAGGGERLQRRHVGRAGPAGRARRRRPRPRPTLTRTTSWPCGAQGRDLLAQRRRSTDASITPRSSVSDDVPILATSAHSDVRLVLEAEVGDPDDVAVAARRRAASSRGTPSRFSWWSMYDSASGVVTSLSATARSTWRPMHAELVLADALDADALGLGPEDDEARRRSGCVAAGLVRRACAMRADELAHALRR